MDGPLTKRAINQSHFRQKGNHIGVRRGRGIEQKMMVYIMQGVKPLLRLHHICFFQKIGLQVIYKLFNLPQNERLGKYYKNVKRTKIQMRLQKDCGFLWPIHQNQMRNVSFSYKQTSLYVFDSQEYIHTEYKLYNNRAATLIRLVVELILSITVLFVCLFVFHC